MTRSKSLGSKSAHSKSKSSYSPPKSKGCFSKTKIYGGVLPYAIKDRKILFLLGREVHNGRWSDFGGGVEKEDGSLGATAAREAYEESMGLFTSSEKRLKKRIRHTPFVETSSGRVYLLRIPHDPSLPILFRNFLTYLRQCKLRKAKGYYALGGCPTGYFEKDQVRWVPTKDLRSLKLRECFQLFHHKYVKKIKSLIHPNQ